MMNKVFIVGCGGMGIEVKGELDETGVDAEFCEQNPAPGKTVMGKRVLGVDAAGPDDQLILAIGSPKRRAVAMAMGESRFVSLVSRAASVGASSVVGAGSILCKGVVVTEGVSIGRFCILNLLCTVSHHSQIGDFTTLCPGCVIAGHASVGRGCFLGVGTSVIPGVTISDGTYVGAGSVVVEDLPPGVLAYGNPCRVVRSITPEELHGLV